MMNVEEDVTKETKGTQHVPQSVKDAVFVQSVSLPPYTPTVKGKPSSKFYSQVPINIM